MCTFIFCYENGDQHTFEHIKRVEYVRTNHITVSEQELLTHSFPTKYDLHLFADDSNFTVSGSNLTYIKVKLEN